MMTDQYDTAGCPETDRGNWMQLGEGRIFYPLDPRPEEVFIEDIARSLSRLMRYNGHSDEPISVAQHCVQCVHLARLDKVNEYQLLSILLHDASEAYTGDMIRPLKMNMPEFRKAEKKVTGAIRIALDIPSCLPDTIKHYDNLAFAWEKRDLFKSAREWPNTPGLPKGLHTMISWDMEKAEQTFLALYRHILNSLAKEEEKSGDFWESYRSSRDWRDV